MSKIIAAPGMTGASVGLITWWRLTTDILIYNDGFVGDCQAQDFPIPALPSDEIALKRALRTHVKGRRTLLRTLPGHVYAIVDEEIPIQGDDVLDPEYDVRFKAWVEDEDAQFDRELDKTFQDNLVELYEKLRFAYTEHDLSKWFVRVIEEVQSIRLRDTGGIYFIPQQTADRWRAFRELVHKHCESRILTVPAMRAEDAVEAVLDALNSDAESQMAKIWEELEVRDLGKRALKTRQDRCSVLAKKLRTYENLLGVKLSALRGQLVDVDAAIVDTILMAEGDEEC